LGLGGKEAKRGRYRFFSASGINVGLFVDSGEKSEDQTKGRSPKRASDLMPYGRRRGEGLGSDSPAQILERASLSPLVSKTSVR